jgi:uncharacterized protein YjbI with pentapeptide repeats
MASQHHLAILADGRKAWNEWRAKEPREVPDLRCADLRNKTLGKFNFSNALLAEANLRYADLRGANFAYAQLAFDKYQYPFPDDRVGANLSGVDARRASFHYANLSEVDLIGADLRKAVLVGANLRAADLTECDLTGATLLFADLMRTNLSRARLTGANLEFARLNRCALNGADLTGSRVYGISVWDVTLDDCLQRGLIITPNPYPHPDTEAVTVDNLDMAQFVNLLLNNRNVRNVIDTITSKVVIILGRFSNDRKPALDGIRERLRVMGFVPVLFDFNKPSSKDVTGTVETLARMARFVIADLTDPSSVPHELAITIPFLRTTPVLPLRLAGTGGYSMFDDLQRSYPWVLPTHVYQDTQDLLAALPGTLKALEGEVTRLRGA